MLLSYVCQRVAGDCNSLTKKSSFVSLEEKMRAHHNLRWASTTDGHPVKANDAGGYTNMVGYPGMGFTVEV
jgi:hypothetical protein